MNEQTTVAISIETIEELKEKCRQIIDPTILYDENIDEMKTNVIRQNKRFAREIFQTLNR